MLRVCVLGTRLSQPRSTSKRSKGSFAIFGNRYYGSRVMKDSGFEITEFSNVDYAGCKDSFKSTFDGPQFLGEKLVSRSSKKQDCTALSTAEAKRYVSLSACCVQVLWMRTRAHRTRFKRPLIARQVRSHQEATLETQDVNTNNTNLLNAVSAPVSAVGPSRALNDDEPTYPDDPSMPHLEDIYDSPSVGIFTSSSYDDESVDTHFNNLETTMNDVRGVVVRNKACLVAQGHRQEERIDYDEVFSPVARIEAIRIFLAFASYMGFIVYQMDVKSAFIGDIDKTLFIKQDKKDIMLVQVYVDDIIFGSTKKSWCDEFEELMKNSVKTASTPIETQKTSVKDKEATDVDVYLYWFMIGSLMYFRLLSRRHTFKLLRGSLGIDNDMYSTVDACPNACEMWKEIERNVGYENQRIGNVAGAKETVEQADWIDDTDDDELEDQELVAHYMYMAKLQEVSTDATDSGPIFDYEPLKKEKGDECIFVGYSTQSRAYRVFNKRTRVIMESIHVNFDEFPQMASDHISSDPAPECQTMALNHDSLSPGIQRQANVPQADRIVTTSNELDLLFIQSLAPTVISSENINQAETYAENDQVADDEFVNIFSTPVQDQGETSSSHVDLSNMHTFYQRYPYEHRWTKHHPLEQVIGNPS
nr:ribonuclease H-like domain, reverse transcriptase, RNA-dependent DNA polymerase [Tanacetum cinerariifolium]